ncbi:MAG TPA: hypothetical protein PKC69_03825 [Chitinophagaceae bacterium]|nr:hypothetical protein [Chitinophagaceae bacterium]
MTWLFVSTNFYAILGWTGTVSYLLAYFLLSIHKLKANQVLYHAMNIVGAIGLTANAFYYADFPNVVVNVAWGVIALGAIFFIMKKRRMRS